jgi:hypothetical protein
MADAIPTTGKERPFKPSLIDRFNNWVGELPTPAWLTFVIFGFALVVVQLLSLWLEGGLQERELLPVVIFNGLFTPYLLALINLLDSQALSALNSMRSALDTTESEFEAYDHRLSTMPFPLPLVVGTTMVVLVVLMERFTATPVRYEALGQFRIFGVVFQLVDKSSAFLFGVFITHTIRQLRLVSGIHANHLRVNMFDRRPLQAFSTLTASTAVGLLVGVYGWMVINPDLLMDPVIFGFIAIMTVLAVVVFAWPLYGVHRQMVVAKERALREIDRRSQAVFSAFNERIDAGDYAAIERWNAVIASLDIQHSRISAIPTWPWRPESVRFLLAAIALPLILEILLFLVEGAFGP